MDKKIVVVERKTNRVSNEKIARNQVENAVGTALKSGRGRGWSSKIGPVQSTSNNGMWTHRVAITFTTTSNRASLMDKFPAILNRLAQAACAGNLRKSPWVITEPEGFANIAEIAKTRESKAVRLKELAEEPKSLGKIIIDPQDHFNRLFGRDAQIRRILSALQLAELTDYKKRPHMLFCGDPGGGKTEMTRCMQEMMGKENEAWMRYDAPSMTRAGVLEDLISSSKVPPILFLEEIEKVETDHALRWLLGVMDDRGIVQRTNYRVGNQAKNVRMVVIATCNDVGLLRKIMYGALYSRFKGNVINFPYPDESMMRKILERELQDIPDSDPKWIDAAMDFGFGKLKIRDPREVISIMNVGRDSLMDGQFQRDYLDTLYPE